MEPHRAKPCTLLVQGKARVRVPKSLRPKAVTFYSRDEPSILELMIKPKHLAVLTSLFNAGQYLTLSIGILPARPLRIEISGAPGTNIFGAI